MFGQYSRPYALRLVPLDHDALLFAPRLEPTGVGSRQMDMTSLSRRITRPRVHHRGRLPDLLPLVVAALVASAPNSLVGQAPSTPIDCAITLDSLDARVRRNYAGYMLEVATQRRVQYTTHLTAAQEAARAAALSTEACTRVLRAYIAWFDDPHLFVFQSLTADTAANRRRERTLQFDPRGESALRADFVARRGSLDPIEGIWRDGALRVGVVRSRAASDTLLAIVLTSDTTAWPVGAVRAPVRAQCRRQLSNLVAVTRVRDATADRHPPPTHTAALLPWHVGARVPAQYGRCSDRPTAGPTPPAACSTRTLGRRHRAVSRWAVPARHRFTRRSAPRCAAQHPAHHHRPARERGRWIHDYARPASVHRQRGLAPDAIRQRSGGRALVTGTAVLTTADSVVRRRAPRCNA
jgi:hypothetical protein